MAEDGPPDGGAAGAEEEGLFADSRPAKPITLRLVLQSSLQPDEAAASETLDVEGILGQAGRLKTLHLEWQAIAEIANLDAFDNAEVLYLQYNQISRIDGLESLCHLHFLALQHNRISDIENLRHLRRLEFLDLSQNRIDDFSERELPVSINILNLGGNPCVSEPGYRDRLLKRLPDLVHLDGVSLSGAATAVAPAAAEADEGELLQSGERGLSAYWRRDELRSGLADAVSTQIQAYSLEALGDVEGLGGQVDGALLRSRERRQDLEASASASLTDGQLAEVRRLTDKIRANAVRPFPALDGLDGGGEAASGEAASGDATAGQ